MVEIWDEFLINAKYHLAVARRMHADFLNYETKRFLSSTIGELAISSSYFINATLARNAILNKKKISKDVDKRIKQFKKIVNPQTSKTILTIINLKKAQKNSPIEIMKKDEIMLLDHGEYKTLTYARLTEMISNLDMAIKGF